MADRAIDTPAPSRRAPAGPATWPAAARLPVALVAAGTVALVTFAVQAPVLGHDFFGDDFVPLADVASRSWWGYLRDLFLLRDETPNWRFLTGIVYAVLYRAFGLNATPFLATNVVLHAATAALLVWLVLRATRDLAAATFAGAFFGLAAASVPTVGQVTALNNVLAAFLVVLALVLLLEGLERGRVAPWAAGAALAFAAAVAANESSAAVAPVFALVALWRARASARDSASWRLPALVSMPFLALGAIALAGFGACRCTEGDELYASGGHILDNLVLYPGRLLYPAGMEFPAAVSDAHVAAGIATLAVATGVLVFGPPLGRIAAAFLALALVPYLPIELWSATRYVYLASVPFAIVAAVLFSAVARASMRLSPAAPVAVAAVAAGVLGLQAWQTLAQNDDFDAETARFGALVEDLRALPDPPDGAFVYTSGGPVTDFFFQCAVTPAIGEVLWGDTMLFTFLGDGLPAYRTRAGYDVRAFEHRDGAFAPVALDVQPEGTAPPAGVLLLPHVAAGATGNLCREDVPQP